MRSSVTWKMLEVGCVFVQRTGPKEIVQLHILANYTQLIN